MSNTDRTYTVGELRDVIAAKDVDVSNEVAARAALSSAPDPSWDGQWSAVQSAYSNERDKAEAWMVGLKLVDPVALIMGDDYDATPEYGHVLSALNPSWATNTVAPGSFDDLAARLLVAASQQNAPLPTPAPIPQPQHDSGVNPDAFDAWLTGAAAKVGLVTDPPPGTPGTGGAPPLLPSWAKWTLGGLAATAVVLVVAKVKEIL